MKTAKLALVLLLALGAAPLSGCAPGVEVEGGDEVDGLEQALTGCGESWGEAFVHYRSAVDASKERLRHGPCGSRTGLLWEIAHEASRAVMTCGEFRTVIRTSPWAEPLREVLAPSLTLRSLTGELLVIKDSEWQNWTGVELFFEEGLTFWARAAGAYGSPVRVDFAAGGEATWGELTFDEVTGEIGWRTIPATYRVEQLSGRPAGPRLVTVTREGVTDDFALGVLDAASWRDAPLFVLEPLGAGEVLGEGATAPPLYSLVAECDA